MFYWFESKAQVLDRFVKLQDELAESKAETRKAEANVAVLKVDINLLNQQIYNMENQIRAHRKYEEEQKAKAQKEDEQKARDRYKSPFEDVFTNGMFGRGGPFEGAFDRDFSHAFRDRPHFNYGGPRPQGNTRSWDDIKAKYKKDAKQYHPDTVMANGGSEADIAEAQRKMQEINNQYEKDKERYK